MEKLVPIDNTIVLDRSTGGFVRAPITGSVAYPPGWAPKQSPILPSLWTVEVRTTAGSRWYGTEKAWIGSDLRMHMLVNPRDEVLRGWEDPEVEDGN